MISRAAERLRPGLGRGQGAGPGSGGTFRSLGRRNFRLFFAGQLTSQAGTWMQTVSVAWVVLQLTDSGVALGVVTAARFLPVLVLGAWGGVVADRVDRWRFMLTTQIAFTVVAGAFAAAIVLDRLGVGLIVGLSVVFGLLTAVDNPTRRTLVADLVEPDEVPNAVALHSAMMTGSRVIGPALAGVLITTVGVEWCFIINTLSYLAVIGALLAMDRGAIRPAPQVARAKGQLREGLRYVWGTPKLRDALVLLAVIGTLAFEYQVTLPLFAERTLGAGAGGFTTLYSAMSVGSVAGALLMARRERIDLRFLVRASWGLAFATMLLALAPNLALALAAIVGVGATGVFLMSGANALIQVEADDRMRGRALALTAVVIIGSTPIGGPIAGWVSEQYGARMGLVLGAVGAAAVALWVGSRGLAVDRAVDGGTTTDRSDATGATSDRTDPAPVDQPTARPAAP
ncbi:MAG: MFS transporter [Actinomycetota bacterium]